jgi:hypothetical protein
MRKKLIIIFLVSLNLFAASSCFQGYPSYEEIVESRSRIKPIPFEKEKWFDDRGIGVEALWKTRPGLARDLINRNLLVGKSYTEVQNLLGEVEKNPTENSISYALFYDMGVIDPVYVEDLYIKFDDDDKVISNEIQIKMMDGHPDYR